MDARRSGLITTRELAELGFDHKDIERLQRQGVLTRRHQGVYLIGDAPLTFHRMCHAAQLAIGPKGAIAHGTALIEHLLRPPPKGGIDEVHVAIQGRGGRERRRHLVIHRPLTLPAADLEEHAGLPVTTPTRTLLDTAKALPRYARLRALEAAEHHQLSVDHDRLRACRALSQAFAILDVTGARTRSDAEAMFLFVCHDFGIPLPAVNRTFHGMEFDFRWPQARYIVEVDGFEFHDGAPEGRKRFERDRHKGLVAEGLGHHFTRFSASQVATQRARVARVVRGRLGAPPSREPAG